MASDTFVQDESIESVIQRYKGTVYSVALSYTKNPSDADDIFQEVFLIYFRTNPAFNDEEHRKAWLIRTTINCSKRVVDSTYRKRTVPMDEMEAVSYTHLDVYKRQIFKWVHLFVVFVFYAKADRLKEIIAHFGKQIIPATTLKVLQIY